MTKLKIKVTKEILEKTKQCGYYLERDEKTSILANCAVALAVRDIFPRAAVNNQTIQPFYYTDRNKALLLIRLPQEASNYIDKFDCLLPKDRPSMPEIEFEVNIPDEVVEQINIDEVRKVLADHPTLQLV